MEDEQTNIVANGIDAASAPVAPEKTLTVDQVNAIVRREKAAAAEKARRELAQVQQELEQLRGNATQSMGGIQQANPDEIYGHIREKLLQELQQEQETAQQAAYQKEMEQVANNYMSKMHQGKTLYEDFDKVLADFDPRSFPQVVYLASQLENTPAVMYELAKNPQKLANIDYLAQRDHKLAKAQLNRLAESIKNNEQAVADNISTNPPLSRLKPSTTAGADNGNMSLRDLKQAEWLRA
jgi:hypothetical protein